MFTLAFARGLSSPGSLSTTFMAGSLFWTICVMNIWAENLHICQLLVMIAPRGLLDFYPLLCWVPEHLSLQTPGYKWKLYGMDFFLVLPYPGSVMFVISQKFGDAFCQNWPQCSIYLPRFLLSFRFWMGHSLHSH